MKYAFNAVQKKRAFAQNFKAREETRQRQLALLRSMVSNMSDRYGDADMVLGKIDGLENKMAQWRLKKGSSFVQLVGQESFMSARALFPFPADGTDAQPKAGVIDLLTYIVRQPVPQLKDEPEMDVYWSDNFKYFIQCW